MTLERLRTNEKNTYMLVCVCVCVYNIIFIQVFVGLVGMSGLLKRVRIGLGFVCEMVWPNVTS